MWQEKQTKLLRGEIESNLVALRGAEGLYDLVEEPLSRAGRGLANVTNSDSPWHLLLLVVCDAISGRYEQALPAAASRQFLITAADVFDDIEDADSSESLAVQYGSAIATNVATTLLILAEKALTRLEDRGIDSSTVVRVIDAVNSFYTTACIGQHLDLSITPETAVSEDMYFRIISMKSASQVECACHIGALLGNADKEQVDTLSKFGYNLGMASQITNDIQGITQETDIINRRITLPVIFALTKSNDRIRSQLEFIFSQRSTSLTMDPSQIRDLLFHTGAMHYATVIMESYKQSALDILLEMEQIGIGIERLRLFLGKT